MKTIDLELIQDIDTNFLLYDNTNRTAVPSEIIDIDEIQRVTIVFKESSDELIEDKEFIIDTDQKARVEGKVDLTTGHDWSMPINFQSFSISYLDGETFEFTFEFVNLTSALEIATHINNVFFANEPTLAGKLIAVVRAGVENYIDIESVNTGLLEEFTIVSGDALETLGLTVGTYRGNGIDFTTVLQEDFIYQIKYTDFQMGWLELPEANWVVDITTKYLDGDDGDLEKDYLEAFEEFTFKQTELYWAKLYETIAQGPYNYLDYEYRNMTNPEKFIFYTSEYDARVKALKASIGVGRVGSARDLVLYCQNVRNLNPLI